MSSSTDGGALRWRKSSYSTQGNCVEVAEAEVVYVRDTKDRDGHLLTLPRTRWSSFVSACRRGEFVQ